MYIPAAHLLTAENKGYPVRRVLLSDITSMLIFDPANVFLTYCSTRGGAILSGSDPPMSLATYLQTQSSYQIQLKKMDNSILVYKRTLTI